MSSADVLTADLYSDVQTAKPVFENHPTLLGKYWNKVGPKLQNYAHELGVNFNPGKIRIAVKELPTYVNSFGRIVGKVFGVYKPGTNKLRADPVLFPELGHPLRYRLQNDNMLAQSAEDVLTHEGTHAIQDQSGAINNYIKKAWFGARSYIEGMATKATEYLTKKKQPVYAREQKEADRIISNYGFRKAFLGHVPEHSLNKMPVPTFALAYVRFRPRLSYSR